MRAMLGARQLLLEAERVARQRTRQRERGEEAQWMCCERGAQGRVRVRVWVWVQPAEAEWARGYARGMCREAGQWSSGACM